VPVGIFTNVAVNVVLEAALTVTDFVALELPPALVAVNRTVYVPAVAKA
jgi:hypothetical protein